MKKLTVFGLILALCMTLLAACKETPKPTEPESTASAVDEDLQSAREIVYNMYKDLAAATPSDYELVAVSKIGDVTFPVEWSVAVKTGAADAVKVVPNGTKTTIDVNEQTPEQVDYTLTATIKNAAGKTETFSFDHYIPAYKEFDWNDYVAAEKGATVVVKGVVTGIISKTKGNSSNCLYLQDSIGGFYVYNMAEDPVALGIQQGYTVRVTGERDTYSGTYEIQKGAVEILDTTTKMPEPVDYTEIYNSAKDLKDEALAGKQALYVTVKNVTIMENGGSDGSYYYFGNDNINLKTYVRLSSSVCPITKDEQTTFKEQFASHFGFVANVTGVICVYDGAFYLSPVTADAIEYIGLPEKSDAEKAEFEADNLELPEKIVEDTEIELAVVGKSYEDVTVEWLSDNACAVVEGGKLVITCPDEDTEVKITATVKCGAETQTKEFTVFVEAAATDLYLPEIVETPVAGEAYKLVLFQNAVGKTLYFNGEASGDRYLASTEKADKAVDVFVEEAEGGYKLYFTAADGTKMYIVPGYNASDKTACLLVPETEVVSVWNADAKTFFTTVNDKEFYIGTYRT
ncbi:MAG: hypothetical protein IKR43_00215, partial [Lachnospiraceae bacterium]|nr:hypothetical protein [Lachnospiraceae bacterium]